MRINFCIRFFEGKFNSIFYVFAIVIFSDINHSAFAQVDTSRIPLKIRGYVESYYLYDFDAHSDHLRPQFLYSHNRHNEVNLNIGFIQAEYLTDRTRGKFALMAGTYVNTNLADEPDALRNIFEANVGVKISRNRNLWVDAGIFASHLGFESVIGVENWVMTRSLAAESSPYYLAGSKISYTSDNQKWVLSGLVINGWQRIQRVPGSQLPSFGHQITYNPSSKIKLNSSSFIGSDTPDSTRRMRYFHNFYGQIALSERVGVIVGFDIGAEQKSRGSSLYSTWVTPVLVVRYIFSEKLKAAGRYEYFLDANGVIVFTGTPNGFQVHGYSINLDYQIDQNVVWRLEGRSFTSNDKIFITNRRNHHQLFFVGTVLAISF